MRYRVRRDRLLPGVPFLTVFRRGVPVLCLFGAMLFCPRAVFEGTRSGLLLWAETVFPTLFPFMLVSGLMVSCGGITLVAKLFGRASSAVFGTSDAGAYAVLTGFLCGYPMGAKSAADLVRTGSITREEGAYLLSFCNNVSPGFIINYVVWGTLGREDLLLPTLLILTGVPVFLSFPFRYLYRSGRRRFPKSVRKTGARDRSFDLAALDSGLNDSYEAIVHVGLYIIFFSILIRLFQEMTGALPVIRFVLPLLEITGGIRMLGNDIPDMTVCYPLVLGLTSFGGFCAAAQTRSMLKETGIPMSPYIIQKLTAAAAASLLGFLYLYLS